MNETTTTFPAGERRLGFAGGTAPLPAQPSVLCRTTTISPTPPLRGNETSTPAARSRKCSWDTNPCLEPRTRVTLFQEDRWSDGGTLLDPHSACIWVRLREQCQRFQTSINISERAVAPNAVCPGRTRVPSSAIGRRFEWCGGDVARRFVGARPSGGSRGGNGDAGRAKCHGLRSSRPNQQPVRRSSSTRDHFPSLGCDAFYRSRQPLRSNSDFEPRRAGE